MELLITLLYPVMAALFFRVFSFVVAIPAAMLLGYLLLPPLMDYNPPVLPSLTKFSTPIFVTLALALIFTPRRNPYRRDVQAQAELPGPVLPGWIPQARWVQVLLVLLVVGPMITALLNRDALSFGPLHLQALTLYDGAGLAQTAVIMILGVLIGRRYLSAEDGHRALLITLLAAGLIYSIPTLAEVRLSPQFHNILYGYFPHSWVQHLRQGGFRPIVFMPHGLVLSMFLCTATIAIAAYMRAVEGEQRILYFLGAAYMLVVVYLSKSLGMTLVALALLPVVIFGSVRIQMIVAGSLAAMVLSYPFVRLLGANPLMLVAQFAEMFSAQRAGSLLYRLATEDRLLERMIERPFFGWGGYGRSNVFTPTGVQLFATDGLWIINIGQRGIVGFLALFGLLCLPVIALALRCRALALTPATSGLCIVLVANLLDLIPNAGLTPFTLLVVGALAGRLELSAASAAATAPALGPQAEEGPGHIYASTVPAPRSAGSVPVSNVPRPATGRIGGAPKSTPAGEVPSSVSPATEVPPLPSPGPMPPGAKADGSPGYSRFPVRHTRKGGRV